MSGRRTCTQCGARGYYPSIKGEQWFTPNQHDDGIVDICRGCAKEEIMDKHELARKCYSDNTGKPYWVYVSKVGGGTLGEMYAGTWEVVIQEDGKTLLNQEIITGTPHDHWSIAYIAIGFLDE